jgi:hypothetical protein
MKKPSIPAVSISDNQLASLLKPMKENIEILNGIRGGVIDPLATTATTSQIISKINELIDRLSV